MNPICAMKVSVFPNGLPYLYWEPQDLALYLVYDRCQENIHNNEKSKRISVSRREEQKEQSYLSILFIQFCGPS